MKIFFIKKIVRILLKPYQREKIRLIISALIDFRLSIIFWFIDYLLLTILYGKFKGPYQFTLSKKNIENIQKFFKDKRNILLKNNDVKPRQLLIREIINKDNIPYCCNNYDLINKINKELKYKLLRIVKSKIVFVNIRFWKTISRAQKGSNQNHWDSFPPGHLKIMIYPNGMNLKNGTINIKDQNIISSKKNCIIFRNSWDKHRGVSSLKKERSAVEITILRSFFSYKLNHNGHYYGRHYKNFFYPFIQKLNF